MNASGVFAPATQTERLLEEGKSTQRKAGELDNRGSHFYFARYWALALSGQTTDADLATRFKPLAETLSSSGAKIMAEIDATQGKPAEIGGYYFPDEELASAAMRWLRGANAVDDAGMPDLERSLATSAIYAACTDLISDMDEIASAINAQDADNE